MEAMVSCERRSTALTSAVRGHGRQVVLLHGLAGSGRYWDPITERLDARFQSWAVDLLGFGRSPKPPESRYDVTAHLEGIVPLLEAGSLLVGHSTGGILAVALARRRPDLVGGLVLTGLPLYPDPAAAAACISNNGPLARWTVEGDRRARWACATMCRLRPVAAALAPLVVRDLPPAVAADGARHTWPAYHGTLFRVVIEHDTADDLSHVRCPVHIVQGDRDVVAPPAVLRRTLEERVQAPGRARIHDDVVAGDHHVVHRNPGVVADAIAAMAGARDRR